MKMNYIRTLSTAAAIVLAAAVASCTAQKENRNEEIAFPEEQRVEVVAGEQYVYKFHSDSPWKLTSAAPWLSFREGDFDVFDLSGDAGEHSVTISVSTNGQGFDEEEGEVKLNIGGTEKTVLTIIRSARGYFVKITDIEGKELKEIDVTYNVYTTFCVNANFQYTTDVIPQIDFSRTVAGIAGNTLTTGAVVRDSYISKPIAKEDGVKLTFRNKEGKEIASYPITYKGLDASFIRVFVGNGAIWEDNDLYQWVLSPDGKTFRRGFGKYGTDGKLIEDSFVYRKEKASFQVTALNDRYRFISVDADINGDIVKPSPEWIHAEVDAGNPSLVTVTADASRYYRVGCLFAVPEALYEKTLLELAEGGNYQRLKNSHRSMLVVELIQCDTQTLDFDIRDSKNDWNRLHAYAKVTDEAERAFCREKFGIDNVFEIHVSAGTPMVIFPMYHEVSDNSKTSVYKSYKIYKENGEYDDEMMDPKSHSEESFWDDWYMFYTLIHGVPGNRNAIYVVYETRSGENQKVLKIIVKK